MARCPQSMAGGEEIEQPIAEVTDEAEHVEQVSEVEAVDLALHAESA